MFFIFVNSSGAAESPAGSLFLSGGNALPSGRGGTGAAASGLDFFSINPASIAEAESVTTGVNYGSLNGEYLHHSVSASLPFAYGVFGLTFSWFSMEEEGVEQ